MASLAFLFLSAMCLCCHSVPAPSVAQDPERVSQDEIESHERVTKAAKDARIEAGIAENETGTDPRSFAHQWAPYYRSTKLENGLIQQDLVANGVVGFTPRLGMFYEVPLAQYRDFDDVAGFAPGTDAIGMGDANLKFISRPKALEWKFGEGGKKTATILVGTEFILPTATDPMLGGEAFVFAPILGLVVDMPLHGFFAMLNLYEFDVYKEDGASDTSGGGFTCSL